MSAQTILGIDIGGTFTDIVLRRPSGAFASTKVLTTPDDPVAGVLAGIAQLLDGAGLATVDRISHATTLGINAIIERRGARVALVTTRGFEDVVEMGQGQRYELYDLFLRFPEPLVGPELRFGLDERMGPDGSVIEPLEQATIDGLAAAIEEAGPEAVAICLLHSYGNAGHEQAAARGVEGTSGRPWTCVSSEVVPEIREFPRIATTVANAYIGPRVGSYLTRLDLALRAEGFQGSFVTMLSNGGLSSADIGARYPVRLLESGPVGGSVMAASVARAHGRKRALIFDMGGTTAKLSVIVDGVLEKTREFEVARVHRFRRGSGMPIQVPSVDVFEIGAGGGSVARIDAMGLVAVGPESAGADPGPACYGRGGTRPTVTDANLVLGYLSEDGFRASGLEVAVDLARRVIVEHIADPLRMTLEEAAWAIHSAATNSMIAAARVHLAERGLDPKDFSLIALGGSGPVHAEGVAAGIGVGEVVIPPLPGVGSAAGLTMAPVAFDVSRSMPCLVDDSHWSEILALYAELEDEARSLVSGITEQQISVSRSADLQLVGQVHELEVPLPSTPLESLSPAGLTEAFVSVYTARFHHAPLDRPLRGITWRLRVSAAEETVSHAAPPADGSRSDAPTDRSVAGVDRMLYLPKGRGWTTATALSRPALPPGFVGRGPALIEDPTTTVLMLSDATFHIEADLSVSIQLEDSPAIAPGRPTGGTGADTMTNTELQNIWYRLVSVVDECWAATYRGAFSTIVGEALDIGCELLDARGESLAHATKSIPVFNMIMPNTVRAILEKYPPETINDGDVFITNDPWLCAGHLPDVAVVTPIVREGQLLGFVANVVNVSDIGGNLDRPRNRELFDEGLQIPIVRLCAGRRRVGEVWEFILGNVRTPDEVEGDLVAMVAANDGAAFEIAAMVDRDGIDLAVVADALGARAEAAMRTAIQAIPNGSYAASWVADGFEEPIELNAVVAVLDDHLSVTFPAAPRQVETGAFNCTLSYTRGHVNYALKCLLAPDVPTTERCFRPIEVDAAPGSIFNCERPAAVDMRTRIGWQVHPLIFRALAPVIPDRVIAGCGQPSLMSLDGEWADGERFQEHLMIAAGLGASQGARGESVSTFPSSAASGSVELLEQRSPLLVHRRSLARDSAGGGRHAGGLGEELEFGLREGKGAWFRVVIALERMFSRPYGLFGGGDGQNSRIEIRNRRTGEVSTTSDRVLLLHDSEETVIIATAGGGAFGSAGDTRTQARVEGP